MNEENKEFNEWHEYGIACGWISDVYDASKEDLPLTETEKVALENGVGSIYIPFMRLYGPRYFDKTTVC